MDKMKKCNRTNIGGQAVMEGVMMRGTTSMCTSVRDEEGNIRIETERVKSVKEKPFVYRMPIVRGVISFFSSLVMGTKTLMRSAEVYGEEEPSKFDKWLSKTFKIDIMSVIMTISLLLGLALALFLFIWLPQTVTGLLAKPLNLETTSVWFNLIEGLIKMLVFTGYILLTSLMKDVKRTYMYHGAEHKTINCYEYGLPLTVQNVKKCSRIHDRCGTTFMFFVMFVSILVFSLVNGLLKFDVADKMGKIYRILLKIGLLPVVAGLSYELLKGLAKTDCPVFLPIKAPGMLLQKITTKEPDDSMIEVAINSFNMVLAMDKDPSIQPQKFITPLSVDKLLANVNKVLTDGNILDTADGEWIVSITTGVKRSQLAESKKVVSASIVERALNYAKERITGRPLWYIIGDTEFYGYKIKVDNRVLIPRPETEELVSCALKYIDENSKVLDMCTGSGAIAIAINKESHCTIHGVDVSKEALNLANENALLNQADVTFIESNLFENLIDSYDLIVSNPPYIRTADIPNLDKEVKFEPSLALDGGEDGLEFYRLIEAHFNKFLNPCGKLVMECGINQADDVCHIFKNYKSQVLKDLNGVDRIIIIEN